MGPGRETTKTKTVNSGVANASYSVTASSAGGCSANANYTVVVSDLAGTITVTNATCNGTSTGSINVVELVVPVHIHTPSTEALTRFPGSSAAWRPVLIPSMSMMVLREELSSSSCGATNSVDNLQHHTNQPHL